MANTAKLDATAVHNRVFGLASLVGDSSMNKWLSFGSRALSSS